MKNPKVARSMWSWVVATILLCGASRPAIAQDRLKLMSGYEQYRKMQAQIPNSVKLGSLEVKWEEDGKAFTYQKEGKTYRYGVAARKAVAVTGAQTRPASGPAGGGRRGRGGGPPRGRQLASALSPDGKFRALCRDRNVYLRDVSGGEEISITTDGSEKSRIKNGAASWVYGEELEQTTAMWWSPDSTRIAFYRFDETHVPDFYLQLNQTRPHDGLGVEAYPLPGDPNPLVDLLVYDVNSKTTVKVDVRDGRPFDDSTIGHYVYHVSWSQDGSSLLFYRTNRRQNVMEFVAADPRIGACRVIVHEQWPPSWVENIPTVQFLKDGKRFVWSSQRTGWKNFYLYDLDGRLLATLTDHAFDAADIARIDEEHGTFFYTARDGDNPMKLQLHRVKLDGTGNERLTDPAFNHEVDVAPDGTCFIDIAQTHDSPPVTRLVDAQGRIVDELVASDLTRFEQLGLRRVELISFKAADGQTDLYGMLQRPSSFDPNKKYPLLVSVYAGPVTNAARETFTRSSPLTELGFLVASFDSRSAGGRGKRALDSIYEHLGRTEIDDQAAGVKSLWERPYLDKTRVGIFGTSYGGYAAAMCLLRYPDVYRAACCSSPVTDFRDYDSIYTERYMWLPDQDREGYDAASLMTYAANLKGRLMLYYGTADNNVHPSNTLQFIAALQRAGSNFDLQVGPDRGHSGMNQERMMEFFIENLGAAAAGPEMRQ